MRLAGLSAAIAAIASIVAPPLPAIAGAAAAAAASTRDARALQDAPSQLPAGPLALAIRQHIDTGAGLAVPRLSAAERADLNALYTPGGDSALWIDPSGLPAGAARVALELLASAPDDGLDPASYGLDRLQVLSSRLREPAPAIDTAAAFDVSLSAGVLRYFRHLHLGRVDPRALGFELRVTADPHDFAMLLRTALVDGRLPETAAGLRPPLAQYRGLRSSLARYRALAADPNLVPVPPSAGLVRPGDSYPAIQTLHRWLVAVGDLPPGTPPPGLDDRYEGAIVDAVRRYQERHGLDPDGVIGKATLEALHVPLAWRVRQIEMALERLRWLPDLGDRRLVALNIPMFHLLMWDEFPPTGVPTRSMRAIVGRAISTQTPVFADEMQYLIFRPYWNVPASIVRNEILPAIRRDAGYLARNRMEIVRGPGDDARPVPATPENLALLARGALRLRQRPGPHNALGLVKFVFPNDENVYLHGTPSQELFSRTRRDFSHGCVRVEDPVALAEWVLAGRPEWTRERIVAAMASGPPLRVDSPEPIQVILFYVTAAVWPEDGTLRFAADIYGHDATLDRALSRETR